MKVCLVEAHVALFQNKRDKLVELKRELFKQHMAIHTAIRKVNEALEEVDTNE